MESIYGLVPRDSNRPRQWCLYKEKKKKTAIVSKLFALVYDHNDVMANGDDDYGSIKQSALSIRGIVHGDGTWR